MANNNNSDDDDQISDDDLGSFIFGDLNEDTLRIQAETLDDLFTGVSSKRRFTRQEGEEHKRFLPQQELFLYVNYHIVPHIRQLLASGQNLFIW